MGKPLRKNEARTAGLRGTGCKYGLDSTPLLVSMAAGSLQLEEQLPSKVFSTEVRPVAVILTTRS